MVLVGLGVGAYFLFGRDDSGSDNTPQQPVRVLADALTTHNADELRGALCAARSGQADAVKSDAAPVGVTIDVGAAHVNGDSGTVDVTTHYQGQSHPGSIPVVRENGQWKACPATVGETQTPESAGSGGPLSTAPSAPNAHTPAYASGRCAHATSTRGATDEFVALATSGQDAAAVQCATGTVAPIPSLVATAAQLRGKHFTYTRALTTTTSVYTGSDGRTLFVGAITRAPYGYFITDASFE